MAAEQVRPRVLMIVSKFFPAVGGTENQALLLCESLIKKGLDVSVLTRHVPGLPEQESVGSVPVHRSIRVINKGKLFGVSYFLSCLCFLVVHRRKFDIIHCHILSGFHSLAAVLMKCVCGKKVIIKVSSTGFLSNFIELKNSLFGSCMIRFLRHADRLVTLCSQAFAEAAAQGFADTKIAVIPNGVDAGRFKPQQSQGSQRKRIVYVGSLVTTKGVDILIDALYSLRQEQQEIALEIFGSGPAENQLKEKSAALGLADAVRFYGTVTDIEHYLGIPCIVVQPSLSEGMSNVILEAMAAGLPVVATRTGAAPDIIQDTVNGLLVDVGSAEQIHDAIGRLLADEGFARRIGVQARASIESTYAIDIVAGQYLSLYRSLNGTSG